MAAALALTTGLIAIDSATAFAAAPPPVPRQVYAGGATFPELYYRRIMNCFGSDNGGALTPSDTSGTCTGTPANASITMWYAGVGSGNGKKAWGVNDAGPSGFALTFSSTYPAGNCRAPDASPTTTPYFDDAAANPDNRCTDPYPTNKFSFAGSDDPIVPGDLTNATYGYDTNSDGWGTPKAFPMVVGGVALGFNPAAGWTESGADSTNVADGAQTSKLKLTTAAWCGIMTGQITSWDDPAILATNPGLVPGASQIRVAVRQDGSGTTFIMANALVNQCPAEVAASGWPTTADNNYFINRINGSQIPSGAVFVAANGNGGVRGLVQGTPGTIGYLSSDQVNPFLSGSVNTANLQTWYTKSKNKPAEFYSPAPPAFTNTVKKLKAPVNTCTDPTPFTGPTVANCSNNPFNWTKAEPAPLDKKAYPIAGFTFAFTYTCFAHQDDVDALIKKSPGTNLGFFKWYFGKGFNSVVKPVAASGGFAVVPGSWKSKITKLLMTDPNTSLGTPGQANTGCASVAGTGANP
jgi:ABC-type phosphate transport system substrate-binding protein